MKQTIVVILFFLLSCGQNNKNSNEPLVNSKGQKTFTNDIAVKLVDQNDKKFISESTKKSAFLSFAKDTLFQLFRDLDFGYRLEDSFEKFQVYEDKKYLILIGIVARDYNNTYMFTLLYENKNENFELSFVQVGDKIYRGDYPKGIIPD